jgi:hypothetical protein
VARVLSTAIVLALLAATAVAFAITEGAKLDKSPIAATFVDPIFSPDGTKLPVAHVRFRLRSRERLTVWVQDKHGDRVATLLPDRTLPKGTVVRLAWNGLTPSGLVEPDGVYMPVVKLERSHRTIVLPSEIRLDTKPPVITVTSKHPRYPILSPDGDGHRDTFAIHYRISERANAILAVRGRRVLFLKGQKTSGELLWRGQVRNSQHQLVRAKPGRYLLTISARDTAGNVSKGVPFDIAHVRYLALGRTRVVVRPGGHFALRVSTDAPTVTWRLHGRSGVQRAGTLRLRAPKSAGVYRLYVTAAKHAAKCTVVVA